MVYFTENNNFSGGGGGGGVLQFLGFTFIFYHQTFLANLNSTCQ